MLGQVLFHRASIQLLSLFCQVSGAADGHRDQRSLLTKLFDVVSHSFPESKTAKEPVNILLDTHYYRMNGFGETAYA